jgi:hypothetical protein
MPLAPPKKPFENYKWRWATLTPTEGLNLPPVYLGVLRVLYNHEGRSASSPSVRRDLRSVERDLRGIISSRVSLARKKTDRNLFRNSQQYWKALGLLQRAGRFTKMSCEIGHASQISLDGSTGIVPQVQIIRHSLSQWGHD